MMSDIKMETQEYFNQVGGVLYSTIGMLTIDSKSNERNISMLIWLLLSEAIARIKKSDGVMTWFNQQLTPLFMLDPEIKDYFEDYLNQHVNFSLPILLFSKGKKREELWDEFNKHYSNTQKEKIAIRKLLFVLLTEQPENLFKNDHWRYDLPNPEDYASPDMCAIAKLGQTLKYLKENCSDEEVELFEEWKDILGNQVLKVLPNKITPGFAKESPLFESLVLSLLHTSALLTQKEINSVKEYIKDSSSNRSDGLSVDQIVLMAALYGLVTRYDKNSTWIDDIDQRRLLSRQALLISFSLNTNSKIEFPGIDPIVFYSTKSGRLAEFCNPYLEILTREYSETANYSEGIFNKSSKYQLCVGGAFQIGINHKSG